MKKTACVLLSFILLLFPLSFSGCGKTCTKESVAYFHTRTALSFTGVKETAFNAFSDEAFALEKAVDDALSLTKESSEISALNKAEVGVPVALSFLCYSALTAAKTAYDFTGGAFNPAVLPLLDLWALSATTYTGVAPTPLPTDGQVKDSLEKTDFSSLSLYEDGGLYYAKKEKPLAVDLGGIAKGYVLSLLDGLVEKYGFTNGYISLGSSSLAVYGESTVGVRNPRSSAISDVYLTVPVSGKTFLSTSGDYERFYTVNGVRYSHAISPATGKPAVGGAISATVFGDPVLADALTTALCVKTETEAKTFMKELTPFDAFAVYEQSGFHIVTGLTPAPLFKVFVKSANPYTLTHATFAPEIL